MKRKESSVAFISDLHVVFETRDFLLIPDVELELKSKNKATLHSINGDHDVCNMARRFSRDSWCWIDPSFENVMKFIFTCLLDRHGYTMEQIKDRLSVNNTKDGMVLRLKMLGLDGTRLE